MSMPVARRLADFAAGLSFDRIPSEVIDRARLNLMDWLGCTLAAHQEESSLILRGLARELSGPGEATLVAYGERRPGLSAALVNGAMSHVMEYDDIDKDSIFHPAAPVIAAALAAAEMAGAGGRDLLAGIVAGYEVATRIGRAINPSHYRFWHTTATVGAFGAAAAGGRILGLDPGRLAHALGLAATQAAGLGEVMREENMAKPLHAGKAAYNGLFSVMLARRGFTAAGTMLEGEQGFMRAMSREPRVERATAALGERWHVLENTYKYYGCCGHTHAAIDCIRALRAGGLEAEQVKQIRIRTYSRALQLTGKFAPRTVFEAKFSLPYCVAVGLADGAVGLPQMLPQRIGDPALHALMARMTLEADPAADAAFPGERHAAVTVETTDGRRLSHRVTCRKGDPGNPVTPEELEEKFTSLAGLCLGQERARRLLAAVRGVDHAEGGLAAVLRVLHETGAHGGEARALRGGTGR